MSFTLDDKGMTRIAMIKGDYKKVDRGGRNCTGDLSGASFSDSRQGLQSLNTETMQ